MRLPSTLCSNGLRWKRLSSEGKKETLTGWLFASPWVLGFLLFTAGPMIYSTVMSFSDYDLFNSPRFIGFTNYKRLVTDPLVWHALKVTTLYAVISVPLHLVAGLFIAVLLNQKVRLLGLFRTIYYVPSILPSVAVLLLWTLIFNETFGLLNFVLSKIGITGPNWLGDPRWALGALVIMSMWGIGGGMLVYLAGLQGIPTELYEAARIDGATSVQRFIHVTLPLLSPVIFFNLVMGIIGSLQIFNAAYIMTRGGPVNATYFFMLHIYYKAFQDFQMGYASALAWVLFIYIAILTALVFRSTTRLIYYGDAK